MDARLIGAAALLCASLAGCQGGSEGKRPAGDVLRAEAGCDLASLPSPLRQTLVFLDARAIRPADDARAFAERNRSIRDILLTIADPGRIGSSGLTALRERVSIAVLPADGSPGQLIFTGCPPGLSPAELAAAKARSSSVAEFFTGEVAGKFADQADRFREQLIGALTAAGARAAESASSGAIADAPVLAGLKASRALLDAKDRASRVILISDLSPFASSGGFAEGLAAGARAGGQFRLAETHIVTPAGRPIAHRDFLGGWLLAQGAQLASAGSGRLAAASPPPQRLRWFEGEASYPSGGEPIAVRIGDDGAGKLSGSWLTLRGTPDRATPMTGTLACSSADRCEIRSDDGGFAQVWGGVAGGPPRFNNEWPFAGMRSFRLKLDGRALTGRVYDESVYVGEDRRRDGIDIAARATNR